MYPHPVARFKSGGRTEIDFRLNPHEVKPEISSRSLPSRVTVTVRGSDYMYQAWQILKKEAGLEVVEG